MAFKAKHKKIDKKDSTGGFTFLHGIYDATVNDIQVVVSDKTGSTSLRYVLDIDGLEVYGYECFISGKAKGHKTYYTTKSGKDLPLPGYVLADELTIASVGKSIMDCDKLFKKKTVTIMKKGKKTKGKGMVLTKAIGKKIKVAMEHQVIDVEDKKFKPTGEFKEVHTAIKFFNKKGLTPLESEMKSKPVFINKLTERLKKAEPVDKTKNKAYTNNGKKGKKGKKDKKDKKFDI